MRKLLSVIVTLLMFHSLWAVELTMLPTRKPVIVMKADSVVIPIKTAGKLLLIEASVDGIEGNFIVDTGAPYLVLNRTYFRDYLNGNITAVTGVGGSTSEAVRSQVGSVDLDGLSYQRVDVDLTDLGNIEEKRGVRIHGLFGLEMLSAFGAVQIDIRNRRLVIYKHSPNGGSPAIVCPLEATSETLFMQAEIAGAQVDVSLDTGAELNVISAGAPEAVFSAIAIRKRSLLTSSTGDDVEVLLGTLNEIKLAGFSFFGMPAIITQLDAIGDAYQRKIDGMLGIALIERGRVVFNFENQRFEMYFYE